jgi:hypothetical protein
MSATNSFENGLLQLIFNNTALEVHSASGGSLQGSGNIGLFYFALFTSSPGEVGSIAAEATYGGYIRVGQASQDTDQRTSVFYPVANGQVINGVDILFPECVSGSQTITHWALCSGASGANILIYGALSSPILIASQVQPRIPAGSMIISLD